MVCTFHVRACVSVFAVVIRLECRRISTIEGLTSGIYANFDNVQSALKMLEGGGRRVVVVEECDTDGFKLLLRRALTEDFPKFWRKWHLKVVPPAISVCLGLLVCKRLACVWCVMSMWVKPSPLHLALLAHASFVFVAAALLVAFVTCACCLPAVYRSWTVCRCA